MGGTPNHSREPMPGDRLGFRRSPVPRHGSVQRHVRLAMHLRATFAALLCVWLCGCTTTMVRDGIATYASVRKEIRSEFLTNRECPAVGSLVGQARRAGRDCFHYQFIGLLTGAGSQALHVYVPLAGDRTLQAIITEAPPVPTTNSAPAYLFFGDATYPWGPKPRTSASHSMEWLIADNGQDWIRQLYIDPLSWRQYPVSVDVAWRARSKTAMFGRDLQYVYAAPIDIVTFPFQLVLHQLVPTMW